MGYASSISIGFYENRRVLTVVGCGGAYAMDGASSDADDCQPGMEAESGIKVNDVPQPS